MEAKLLMGRLLGAMGTDLTISQSSNRHIKARRGTINNE